MNKQSFITTLLTLLLSMTGAKALAHDIEALNGDGKTIYYNWINNHTELEVTGKESYSNTGNKDYVGNVVIPATVVYQGSSYQVTSIGKNAFWGCSYLTSITIPNSVTSIGFLAFSDCSGLTSITVESGNKYFDSRNNCNAIIDNNNQLIVGCKGTIIPNSVTTIGEYAFYGSTNLTSLTIPNNVTTIGSQAFAYCRGMTSITIHNGVTSIGDYAFQFCVSLTSITIPNSVTSIGYCAFWNCSDLTSIQVESGNQYYDSRNNCNAIIDSNNQLILGCKNTIIPNSVTSIGSNSFYGCNDLTSIKIPNNVTTIGHSAFRRCTELVYITLPSNLISIGSFCFYECNSLTYIYCNAKDVPSVGNQAFENRGNTTLYVPSGSVTAYKNTSPWSKFNVQTYTNSQSTEKCSKPTIKLSHGSFNFYCETPDVQYHWIVSTPYGNMGETSSVYHSASLSVFATKDGYQPSDVATYNFSGFVGDVNNDGEVNVADHVKLSEIIMNQNE